MKKFSILLLILLIFNSNKPNTELNYSSLVFKTLINNKKKVLATATLIYLTCSAYKIKKLFDKIIEPLEIENSNQLKFIKYIYPIYPFPNYCFMSIWKDNVNIGGIGYTGHNNVHVLLDFYIKEKYRKNGYGETVLKETINYLYKNSAKAIIIEPEPFEYLRFIFWEIPNALPAGPETTKKFNQLADLYKRCGFDTFDKNITQKIYQKHKLNHISKFPLIHKNSTYDFSQN